MSAPAPASGAKEPAFKVVATSQADEDAFDYVNHRVGVKKTGVVGSVAHIVKGALGGGILSGHVGYMKAGVGTAITLNFAFGIYMGYCLHLLVASAQVLYRRTRIPSMSYADVGEAAVACCPSPKVRRFAKPFRYVIDVMISMDLFGACACYQIIISKSLKQLVENVAQTSMEGKEPGYPDLRVYIACMIPFVVCICLITHLKYLAPFSLAANMVIILCICLAVYYAFHFNPKFENLVAFTEPYNQFEFTGMVVFSMSCSGVVIAIENNMGRPHKFPLALTIGMGLIMLGTFSVSFFGYSAFLDKCESPITVNFPMSLGPKILKGFIVLMIYITHALNFYVPFNLCFHYIKIRVKNPDKVLRVELICRAIFVTLIGIIAIIFPNIDALMGFLGAFCLSNMAFIWPNIIYLLVVWERPGFGKYRWRLVKSLFLISIGIFLLICGSLVNAVELVSFFINM